MPKTTSNDNTTEVDLIDDEVWTEGTEATVAPAPPVRNKPKWRTIEQYWEERRLREQIKDYLADEE